MKVLEVPLQIDRDRWLDALESLGIPVRGHGLVRIEADPGGIVVTYRRRNEKGESVVGLDHKLATVQVVISLAPHDMWAKDGAA